ncbi:exopolyphosphatase [Nematocida minor]|uniref:exopolyphosphatase n=1 Tax=Nematocida minor TaxID=1912983 RepID=UPI0022204337|nr:exopolyphosphatase [Nematocida minor]KAI5191319.1 exopolyphosphatase [Nematocida minor]
MDKYTKIVGKSNLKTLLNSAYSHIAEGKIEVVMGNPSCDQDSFIGSHILAAMEGRIPVVNLSKEIFKCKKDLVTVCGMMGIDPEQLVYLVKENNEWILQHGAKKYPLKDKTVVATIIDFNLPDAELLLLENFSVDRVIDHHPILEFNEMHSKVEGMTIELNAGSCCSLIYRHINSKYAKLLEEKKQTPEYNFLLLLTIPIMTDTSGLEKRVHNVDIHGVHSLLESVNLTMDDSQSVLADLKKFKKCESEIATELILQMDYKSFNYPAKYGNKTFGISSAKYAYEDWVQRDGSAAWKQKIKEFVEKNGHEFFLLNVKVNNVREFYVYNLPSMEFIEKGIYQGKPVEKREINGDKDIVVYKVDNAISRKIVAPMIYKYLESK